MKPIISTGYAALNKDLHAHSDEFGSAGHKDAPQIVGFCREHGLKSILDFGCGKGGLKTAIQKLAPDLKVWEFDPAILGKDKFPKTGIDFVVALDVMEHIEPDFLENVLQNLQHLRPKVVLLVIALTPAVKFLADGRNAHLIVEPVEWWEARLKPHFQELHRIVTPAHFTFIGAPCAGSAKLA
jgi:SAM-dependent methyltransferase